MTDIDPAASERCRVLAPHARVHSSLEDLLNDGVDALLVTSPTGEHAKHARLVLATGKALYLEKPLAATLADGLELCANLPTPQPAMIGFNYRFHPLAE